MATVRRKGEIWNQRVADAPLLNGEPDKWERASSEHGKEKAGFTVTSLVTKKCSAIEDENVD